MLLLTADHGVQFREHGRTTYGMTLFDEEIRVPLLVRVPFLSGRRISQPVSSVDHLPSLVDLFSLETRFPVEGHSYLPSIFGRALPRQRVLYAETRKPFHSAAAISGPMKLIWWPKTGTTALFDRDNDPREQRNLVEDPRYQSHLKMLRRKLSGFLANRGESVWP